MNTIEKGIGQVNIKWKTKQALTSHVDVQQYSPSSPSSIPLA
jgi:hypothetical protein